MQGKYKKWARNMDSVWRGVWGHAPRKFGDILALKCVLRAPEAVFGHAHSTYIYTVYLQLASLKPRLSVPDFVKSGQVLHSGFCQIRNGEPGFEASNLPSSISGFWNGPQFLTSHADTSRG